MGGPWVGRWFCRLGLSEGARAGLMGIARYLVWFGSTTRHLCYVKDVAAISTLILPLDPTSHSPRAPAVQRASPSPS